MKREKQPLLRFDVYDDAGRLVGQVEAVDIGAAVAAADKAFPPIEPEAPPEVEALTPEGNRVIGPRGSHGA
jgi:hypothetical protein